MAILGPIGYYSDGDAKPLRFHLIDVGEGLMTLIIFPDDTTMLFDCNVRQDHMEDVLAYLADHIPVRLDPELNDFGRWIDIFVNSHRDQDHYRGLSSVNEMFPVKAIWDSGQTGATIRDAGYEFYMRHRRFLKDKYGNRALVVPDPSSTSLISPGGAQVYCLCSSGEYGSLRFYEPKAEDVYEYREPKVQHTNCIALSIHYAGRSILLTGDTDWKAWKEKIVPNFDKTGLLKTNVLVASHHGSRSFFREEKENRGWWPILRFDDDYLGGIKRIRPSVTLISCGDYESSHHPNKDALEIYKERTAHKQVYTTKEKGGIAGMIDRNGRWTVTPARFKPSVNHSDSLFDIKCRYGFFNKELPSGSAIETGTSLKFSVVPGDGLLDPDDKVRIEWEVSHGGINGDHERQAIYVKPDPLLFSFWKYKFEWEVEYEGRHLIRCRIVNTQKNYDVTRVFVVDGVK